MGIFLFNKRWKKVPFFCCCAVIHNTTNCFSAFLSILLTSLFFFYFFGWIMARIDSIWWGMIENSYFLLSINYWLHFLFSDVVYNAIMGEGENFSLLLLHCFIFAFLSKLRLCKEIYFYLWLLLLLCFLYQQTIWYDFCSLIL